MVEFCTNIFHYKKKIHAPSFWTPANFICYFTSKYKLLSFVLLVAICSPCWKYEKTLNMAFHSSLSLNCTCKCTFQCATSCDDVMKFEQNKVSCNFYKMDGTSQIIELKRRKKAQIDNFYFQVSSHLCNIVCASLQRFHESLNPFANSN